MGAATTAIIGGAMGLGQMASGIIGKSNAQKDLDNLETPNYTNAYEDIEISTIGSDLIKEQGQMTTAGLIDFAKSGGTRLAAGMIPKIGAFNNEFNKEARKYLDDQVLNREYAIADDNTRLRQMEERRYLGELQGIGQAIQANRQDIWSGVRGFGSAAMYAGRNGLFEGNNDSFFDKLFKK
tara:strand:- start:9991 stop:10533 length:543 start_codon:yes stop_codon:yes gene_type:complete